MADSHTARPVSGEIMTDAAFDAATGRLSQHFGHDIVDADYEILPSSEAIAPLDGASLAAAAPTPAGMDMLRTAMQVKEAAATRPARGGPLFWGLGMALAAAAFWVSGGHSLIRQSAVFGVAQAGPRFSISAISSRIEETASGPVLLVEAEAINGGPDATPLPPLEIHVTGNEGKTTRYNLGTATEPLPAGRRFAFSSRLDVPKNGVKTVSVTFGE